MTHHKGDTIAEHLSQCLADWEIEKVFTVTMDNVKGNDKELRLFTKACRQLRPNAVIKDGIITYALLCTCTELDSQGWSS